MFVFHTCITRISLHLYTSCFHITLIYIYIFTYVLWPVYRHFINCFVYLQFTCIWSRVMWTIDTLSFDFIHNFSIIQYSLRVQWSFNLFNRCLSFSCHNMAEILAKVSVKPINQSIFQMFCFVHVKLCMSNTQILIEVLKQIFVLSHWM